MARYLSQNADSIYEIAEKFKQNCLLKDGSLLFNDVSLWRVDLLNQIHKVFVATPDEGNRTFIEKFKDQIESSGPEVIRLAAEMLCVYFLFPSSVGGARKREVVNEILGWARDSIPDDNAISKAFDHGIGSGGQGYNTSRPFQIAFLIEFAIAWKKLPTDDQQRIIMSPWEFQKLVDSIEDAESKQLRHMLLHLLFPNDFERIASGNHKRRVITAFANLIEDNSDNEDKNLLSIREGLKKLLPGHEIDFYSAPIEATWNDNGSGSITDGAPLEVIQYKKQIVLYGPPGTGKTFQAKSLAKRIIRSAALSKFGPARYFQLDSEIESAINNNVHRLQLHPSYSYEDFIRGLHISETGATEYRLGYLPQLITNIESQSTETRLPHVLILDEMNRTDLSRMLGECFSLLEDRNQTIELPARNKDGGTLKLKIPDDLFVIGTMNLIDQSIEQIDFALRRRFLWLLCPFDKEALVTACKQKWNTLNSDVKWDSIENDFIKLANAAASLNLEIHNSQLLGSQYEIGHTYFIDATVFLKNFLGQYATRKQNYLWNKKGEALEPVVQVWNLSLKPLLEQYLAGLDATSRNMELEKLSKALLSPNMNA